MKIFVVLDETEFPCHAATYPRACQEHINDAIDGGIEEASKWVVREFIAAPPAQTVQSEAVAPFGWVKPKGGNYFTRNESSANRIGGMVPVYLAAQPAEAALTDDARGTIREAAQCLEYAVTLTQDGYDGETGPASEWDAAAQRLAGELNALLTAAQSASGATHE